MDPITHNPQKAAGLAGAHDPPWSQLGLHRIRVVHDTVEWILDGPVSLTELQQFEQFQYQIERTFRYVLILVDCHNASGISPQARRYAAEQTKLHPNLKTFSALYGCSPMIVALSTLVVRAITLFSGRPHPVEISRDEASAREQLAAFRRKFQADLGKPPR